MSRLTIRGFENFFEYYKGQPQQKEAVAMLWKAMPVSLLEEDATWIETYRQEPPANSNSNGIPQAAVDVIKSSRAFDPSLMTTALVLPPSATAPPSIKTVGRCSSLTQQSLSNKAKTC